MQALSTFARSMRPIRLTQLARCTKGVFAVEFALLAPIALIALVGAIDMSRAFAERAELQAAAKTGAHYGLVRRPTGNDLTQIMGASQLSMPPEWFEEPDLSKRPQIAAGLECKCPSLGIVACTTTCPAGEFRSATLSVAITKTYQPLFSSPVVDFSFPLSGSSVVRLQ